MIRAFTAYTGEIDDTEAAVRDITEQLSERGPLLSNAVGILTCFSDFVESGVVRELCAALPFRVVGSTTLSNATRESEGRMLLTLLVLSSDDVSFSVGLTGAISSQDDSPLRAGYGEAAAKLGVRPAVMLSFAPLLVNVGGDFFVSAFTDITGGVPNFGMISVDDNSDYSESQIICDGEAYSDRYAFVLLAGNVSPRFFTASISSDRIFEQKGVVTASSGNQLQTVNNLPVVEYLQTLGLTKNPDGTITGINSFPFVVDYNDGAMPAVRVMFATTKEGYAVCGGDIPVGATLSVGRIDAQEVIQTTTDVLSPVCASADPPDCILMFSCVGRYFALGFDPTGEVECVKKILADSTVPYQISYSGGELCPVYTQSGGGLTVNRSHNDTFIMCVF